MEITTTLAAPRLHEERRVTMTVPVSEPEMPDCAGAEDDADLAEVEVEDGEETEGEETD